MNSSEIKALYFPGDKSIAHRLVLLSLLADKKIIIKNLPDSQDVCSSLNIVKKLGVEVCWSDEGKTVVLIPLKSKDLGVEEIVLDCGNSGTTARLLCGILANLKGKFSLIGDDSLSKRPMERVVRPLADLMGLSIKSTDGHLPIYIESNGKTKAANFFNQTGSAQVKSAVLFAGLAAEGKTIVREQFLSRDHSERLLDYLKFTQQSVGQPACSTLFSSAVSENNSLRRGREGTSLVRRIEGLASAVRCSDTCDELNKWQLGGQPACSTLFSSAISDDRLIFCVPGDISSAAYFVVLSLITKRSLKIDNLLLNPTRTGFLKVLKRMCADIEVQIKEDIWEPVGDLIVKGGELKAADITPEEIPSVIDELPILAVAMAFAEGKSRVCGASELRVKESDRISCLISQLKKVGINCSEFDDGYEIIGGSKINSAELDSFGDHRLAMSFAVLAKCAGADLKVKGLESAEISFPEFYDYLDSLLPYLFKTETC